MQKISRGGRILWYDGKNAGREAVSGVKKRTWIVLWALALALAAVFLALVLPGLLKAPEQAQESADIPACEAGDLLECRHYLGKSAEALALPEEALGAQRLYGVAALEGTLFGAPAYGTVYFAGRGAQGEALASAVYLHSQALSYKECFDALRERFGEPFAQGEELFTGAGSGTALWSKFRAEESVIELSGTSVHRDVSLSLRAEDTY